MAKYLIKRTIIRNGIKETSYIGQLDCCYDDINQFNHTQFFKRKMTAQNCMYKYSYGDAYCEVLNIEVVEVK